jgi:PAS domain S-box-containing protein
MAALVPVVGWGWERRALRLAVVRAERRLEATVRSGKELVWECDADGWLTHANDPLCAYFGYSREEIARLTLAELFEPDEHARLSRLLDAGLGWQDETFRCRLKDGATRLFRASAASFVERDFGRTHGLTGSMHSIDVPAEEQQHRTAIEARVRRVLAGHDLRILFQPILSVDTGKLVGAEALSRFDGAEGLTPDRWFAEAALVGLSTELELHAIALALQAATNLPDDIYISVNVSPMTLADQALVATLQRSPIPAGRIVVEVTEHVSVEDYGDLLVPVARLRAIGACIAVDDAGAGYASFRHILRLQPEYIKLDRTLIAGIDADAARQALAAAIVRFGSEMNASILAEGIETVPELRAAQALGIDAAQGYLFGKPTADWGSWTEWHARGAVYSVRAAHHSVGPVS